MEAGSKPVRGLVLRGHAWYYDWVVRLISMGTSRNHVQALLDIARPSAGDRVLDMGCGTGTLAIAASARVGRDGKVIGIDASPEMIERARRKARRIAAGPEFVLGTVEALPFEDRSFDLVFSTLMLHHLPRPARAACLREAHRVLQAGGRLVVSDFEAAARRQNGLLSRLHRHGGVPLEQVRETVAAAGFRTIESGMLGVLDLHYTVAEPA